ncbi:hypothetical protein Q5425_32880 [Amycolatopsis sp. A133]|uniref:hypothetical protein n=1 Tax=Amycolatopsis sp. A133 TaxID=3064472 RepID=UPI0027F53A14|nr:hypothetical protein [Amycolatopsis sp. A133]MDQ7808555.1 hypothetical protein [Amycolatopsis sp. A133]
MYETIHRALVSGEAGTVVPRWIAGVLGEVVRGRTDLRAVRHPLGFVCLPVERTGERGICLHVWSENLAHARPTTSSTHAHSWDLISYVLYGTLRNDLVAVTDAPDGPTHRICEIGSSEHGDEIRRTSRLVRRERRSSELHRQGAVYTLAAGVFHETVARGEVATIALGSGRPGAVDLSVGAVNTGTHRTTRQLCDREETALVAAMVVERLGRVPEPRPREDLCERGRP